MARRRAEDHGPLYYTTFQVARFLGVSPPTVVNWINSGLLVAHRTPGGHRRIAREEILAFARAQNYPLKGELAEEVAPAEKRRVLVVDDNADFCTMVKDYLEMQGGFDVETADSGFAAGLTVARFRPGVILMDIRMPDMDGFEAVRRLREDPEMRSVPVIACTGLSEPSFEQRVQREGFAGYLMKPIKLEHLLAMIEGTLRAGAQ